MNSYKFDGFSLKNTFESHKEFNEFLKSRITFATLKSSLINCSICKSRNHKMRYKIGRCNDVNCNFKTNSIVTLKQIQSFINNRRQKIGDENNLDDLKTFCAGLKYSEGITKEDELYTFGEHYGDGSDTEHFQLGLTSKKMMAKVELTIPSTNTTNTHRARIAGKFAKKKRA
jgi:hypothetical protein